jgi:hypothetical protein
MDVRLHLAAIAANAVAGCGEWSRGSHNYDGDGDAAVVTASLARSRARDGLVAVGAGSFVALYDPEVCASVCVCVCGCSFALRCRGAGVRGVALAMPVVCPATRCRAVSSVHLTARLRLTARVRCVAECGDHYDTSGPHSACQWRQLGARSRCVSSFQPRPPRSLTSRASLHGRR